MKRFKKILVFADTTFDKHPALTRAARLAQATGSTLKVVDVVEDEPLFHARLNPPAWALPGRMAERKAALLEKLVAPLRAKGLRAKTDVLCGKPFVEIIREVLRNRHDLVMKTAHQSGILHLVDSTAMDLLRNCPCPVELVKPTGARRHRSILACVDPVRDDPQQAAMNEKVINVARALAQWERGELHLIHVWSVFGERILRGRSGGQRRELEEYIASKRAERRQDLRDLLSKQGVSVKRDRIHFIKGNPGGAIPRFAKRRRMDLVVMGTVARSGIDGFLIGNTAEKVLSKLDCSLLAVKPDDFVCPVRPKR